MLTWFLSIEFAKQVLTDIIFPSALQSIFSKPHLQNAHVLELGAGTGVLSVLLGPHVEGWIASDLPVLVPLIEKNIKRNVGQEAVGSTKFTYSGGTTSQNQSVLGMELDWMSIAETKAGSVARARAREHVRFPITHSLPSPSPRHPISASRSPPKSDPGHSEISTEEANKTAHVDLILAVDTLYNSALVPSFVAVINEFASPPCTFSNSTREVDFSSSVSEIAEDPTLVVVVSELRDEDVMSSFLAAWLESDDWEIWRVGNAASWLEDLNVDNIEGNAIGTNMLDGPFVVWAGWKNH